MCNENSIYRQIANTQMTTLIVLAIVLLVFKSDHTMHYTSNTLVWPFWLKNFVIPLPRDIFRCWITKIHFYNTFWLFNHKLIAINLETGLRKWPTISKSSSKLCEWSVLTQCLYKEQVAYWVIHHLLMKICIVFEGEGQFPLWLFIHVQSQPSHFGCFNMDACKLWLSLWWRYYNAS